MIKAAATVVTLIVVAAMLSAQGTPPGHPSMPTGVEAAPPPPADPADVESVEAIVGAYYESLSAPAGDDRDWDRLRSLFIPEGHLIAVRSVHARASFVTLTPEAFMRLNRAYFKKGGYFERPVYQQTQRFGHVAQVFSTYEARRSADQVEPHARGVNSFQLIRDDRRWWIVSVMWDHERDGNSIPPDLLPPVTGNRR